MEVEAFSRGDAGQPLGTVAELGAERAVWSARAADRIRVAAVLAEPLVVVQRTVQELIAVANARAARKLSAPALQPDHQRCSAGLKQRTRQDDRLLQQSRAAGKVGRHCGADMTVDTLDRKC